MSPRHRTRNAIAEEYIINKNTNRPGPALNTFLAMQKTLAIMSPMNPPTDRRYLETHEWHKLDGGLVTIGITHFAADELADITFVELPKVGTAVSAGKNFGEIESVKAASDLYSGVDGTIAEVNTELASTPGLVNSDPYQKGWMIRVKPTKPDQINQLLPADEYQKKAGH